MDPRARPFGLLGLALVLSGTPGRAAGLPSWQVAREAGLGALMRGELGLAEQLLLRALTRAGTVGPEHRPLLEDLFAAGALAAEAGRLGISMRLLEASLEPRRALLRASHPALEPHYTLLGTLLLRAGRVDEAAGLLARAARILARRFGGTSPHTRAVVEPACEALRRAGRGRQAEALEALVGEPEEPGPPGEEPGPAGRVLADELAAARDQLEGLRTWLRNQAELLARGDAAALPELEQETLRRLSALEELSHRIRWVRLRSRLEELTAPGREAARLEDEIAGMLVPIGQLSEDIQGRLL